MKEKISNSLTFARQAFTGFVKTGAVMPSSNFLAKKMVKPIKWSENVVIVELGAGTGSFTKEIIKHLPKSGRLIVFEINHEFAQKLKKEFVDKRVVIVEDDASELPQHLNKLGINGADYVVSGIPLGNFSRKTKWSILNAVMRGLKEGGLYIQFQYFLASILTIRRFFPRLRISYEVRNVPPAFVIAGKKINKNI
jgi:phospholipid N-methyltransferase